MAGESDDVLLTARGISKRFCVGLKRSLIYGALDIGGELLGRSKGAREQLREGEFWAVRNINFNLRRGEVLGLIGHNGAGKSTLLKMLNGLLKPDAGEIRIRGRVGALIELGAGFNPILTGRENIYVNGSILGFTKKEIDQRFDSIVAFAELEEFLDMPVQNYSSGMKVRLGFAIAAQMEPEVLLIDEVLAVGDVSFKAKCFNKIGEFRQKGIACILVSHNMHHISRFCTSAIHLKRGKEVSPENVEDAIASYVSHAMQIQPTPSDGSSFSHVHGSGRLRVTHISIVGQNGEKKLDSGKEVLAQIQYECPKEDVTNPILDMVILDSGGIFFQASSRDFGVDFGRMHRNGCIEVRFPQFPSNNQKLVMHMAFWDQDFVELFDWKRENEFEVYGNALMHGRIYLEPIYNNLSNCTTVPDEGVEQ